MATSLSVGKIIRKMLTSDNTVMSMATKVYPIVTDKAELPYIFYRRTKNEQNPVKNGHAGADTVTMEVNCLGTSYDNSIDLAEAVRSVLDGGECEYDGLIMRSCFMSDAVESYIDDAWVQTLVFTIKV